MIGWILGGILVVIVALMFMGIWVDDDDQWRFF